MGQSRPGAERCICGCECGVAAGSHFSTGGNCCSLLRRRPSLASTHPSCLACIPSPPLQVRRYTVLAQEEGQPEGGSFEGTPGVGGGAPTAGGIKGTGGAAGSGATGGGAGRGGSAGGAGAGGAARTGVSGGSWGAQVGRAGRLGRGWMGNAWSLRRSMLASEPTPQPQHDVHSAADPAPAPCPPLPASPQEPEGDLERTKRSPVAQHVLEPQME